jgi:hypothetical protein
MLSGVAGLLANDLASHMSNQTKNRVAGLEYGPDCHGAFNFGANFQDMGACELLQ